MFGAVIVFAALNICAAIYDALIRLIPNWVSVAIALLFLPAAYFAGLSLEQFGWHLVAGVIAFAIGVGLFYLKIWGGGDAKLVAAVCLWMGTTGSLSFVTAFAIAGGVVALPLVVLKRLKLQHKNERVARALDVKKVPYGIAIAVGAFWAAPYSPILQQVIR